MNFSMLDLSRLFQLPWSVSLNNFHDFCSKFYDFNLGDSYLNLIFVSLFEALFQCFVPIFHNFRPQVRYFSIPSQFCSIAGILRAKKVCFRHISCILSHFVCIFSVEPIKLVANLDFFSLQH